MRNPVRHGTVPPGSVEGRRRRWLATTLAIRLGLVLAIGWSGCAGGGSDGSGTTGGPPTVDLQVEIGGITGNTLRPLLGANAGPYPAGQPGNADVTAGYQRIGVTMVRTHDFYGPLDMATMYPDHSLDPTASSSYDFVESDVRFRAIADAGLEVYFRLGDSWNNATPPAPADVARFSQAAVRVLRHYRDGLWNGFHGAIRYVEIWNEPGAQFWPGQTMAAFRAFYVSVATELRQAFPTLKIGGPGWAPSGWAAPTGQVDVQAFLDQVRSAGAPLDFLSWHVYSNDPQSFVQAAQFYRSELDQRGMQLTESHISEWNTQTGDAATGTDLDLRTGALGAAIMTEAWIRLQGTDVSVSTVYRGNDTASNLPTFHGLFYADGSPKKIADAFDLWSDMAACPTELSGTATGTGAAVAVLAGQDSAGHVGVLLANRTGSSTRVGLAFAATTGRTISGYDATVRTVQDGVAGNPAVAADPTQLTIPGPGVSFVWLTPR